MVEETFESVDLPANGWTISDRNASGSAAYWAMASTGFANLAAYEGQGMAYCAGIGFQGDWSDPRAQGYMCAVMEREVDLTGAGMATLSFNYHIPSIAHGEGLEVYLDDRRVCSLTATTAHWTGTVSFVDEHCGSIRTLRFVWHSMGHSPGTGAFLDNVLLTKVPDGSPVVRAPALGAHCWHRRPHFRWPDVSGATWYNPWLAREGRTYQNVWVAAPVGTPTWQPAADLPGGSYQWWVRPWSPGFGLGAWSEAAPFSVETMRPVAPAQLWPSGEQSSGDVEFRGATKVVDHWTPNTYWDPTYDLSPGDYSWWVGAWNSTTRTTIWSARGDFGVR